MTNIPFRILFTVGILISLGCGTPDTSSPETVAAPDSNAIVAIEQDSSTVSEPETDTVSELEPATGKANADKLRPTAFSPLEDSLFTQLPELAECRDMILEDNSGLRGEAFREKGFANIITISCGPSPGTGAYGFPLSLVAEYEAMTSTPEGDVERLWIPIEFADLDTEGNLVSTGYVSQAIPFWDASHLAQGRFYLFYKYAGAGHCGRVVMYETQGWRTGFPIWQVREQSCEEEGPVDPMDWDVIFEQ